MAEGEPQSFANHARFVPPYHFGVFGILVLNFVWSGVRLFRAPSFDTVLGLLVALALLGLFFYGRIFARTVQDRVIRLEMRLRLHEVLPADLHGRIRELTAAQLVALRFASDEEMADLVRDVLAGQLPRSKDIKMRIKNWQADWLRA